MANAFDKIKASMSRVATAAEQAAPNIGLAVMKDQMDKQQAAARDAKVSEKINELRQGMGGVGSSDTGGRPSPNDILNQRRAEQSERMFDGEINTVGSIDSISSLIRNRGLMKTNRFLVDVNLPEVMISNMQGTMYNGIEVKKRMSMMVEQAELPGKSFLTAKSSVYGPRKKVPYGVQFDDLQLSIRCSSSMAEKYFFDDWMNGVQDLGSFNFNYLKEYVSDMVIYVFDEGFGMGTNSDPVDPLNRSKAQAMGASYAVRFVDCYPVTVSPIQVSHANKNEYMKFNVSLTYKYWKVDNFNESQRFVGISSMEVPDVTSYE